MDDIIKGADSEDKEESEPDLHQSYAEATLGNPQSVTKVLGVCWDPDADSFILDLTAIAKLALTVKRVSTVIIPRALPLQS